MTKKIQKELDFSNVRIAFTPYGAEGERVAIKVMDRETGEVIREIPPEEIQSLYSKMGEMAGMLFHKKA
jgi:flagellar protein FlaG